MNGPKPIPNIGDRVQIHGSDETYVVVEVSLETQSVSLIRESEIEQSPLDNLISIDSFTKH